MIPKSKHILVLRFSAMGDVALLTPVVKSFLSAYPNHQITVVSRPKFSAFFSGQRNLDFFPADVDSTFSGWIGIIKLFGRLKKLKPNLVIDLHDHLRSRVICFLFRITGRKVVRFEKGRREKRKFVKSKNKIGKELPHTVIRYKEAFTRAGFIFSIIKPPYIVTIPEAESKVDYWLKKNNLAKNETWIGLAPFAAHRTKIWPTKNYSELIEQAQRKIKSMFFLFGGGKTEIEFFTQLMSQFPNSCVLVAGELSLAEELALIKRLDKMICVDSSNMHLASLMHVPIISIWGGTHPSTGFGPFGDQGHVTIQVDPNELPCRPCSIYGKETCWRGDWACLNRITPAQVLSGL